MKVDRKPGPPYSSLLACRVNICVANEYEDSGSVLAPDYTVSLPSILIGSEDSKFGTQPKLYDIQVKPQCSKALPPLQQSNTQPCQEILPYRRSLLKHFAIFGQSDHGQI